MECTCLTGLCDVHGDAPGTSRETPRGLTPDEARARAQAELDDAVVAGKVENGDARKLVVREDDLHAVDQDCGEDLTLGERKEIGVALLAQFNAVCLVRAGLLASLLAWASNGCRVPASQARLTRALADLERGAEAPNVGFGENYLP